MGTLKAIVVVLVALSMASERIIEIVKQMLPAKWLVDAWPAAQEPRRQALLQAMAGVVAGVIAWLSHDQIAAMVPANMAPFLHWPAYVLLGAMCSAGSGFWNHILDIFRAMKIEREAKAELHVRQLNAQRALAKEPELKKSAFAA